MSYLKNHKAISHCKPFYTALTLAALAIFYSCGNDGARQRPVPKPEAWPRIEVPSAEYSMTAIGPVGFMLNKSAIIDIKKKESGWWADIRYPHFPDATIYLSVTETTSHDALADAIDNRRERMALNAGGAVTEFTRLTSDGGWAAECALTRSSLTTPVQFLASDGHSLLLSGALYLILPPDAAADSVSPIVNAVNRDVTKALKNLKSAIKTDRQ